MAQRKRVCVDCTRPIRKNATAQVVPEGLLHMTCLQRRNAQQEAEQRTPLFAEGKDSTYYKQWS